MAEWKFGSRRVQKRVNIKDCVIQSGPRGGLRLGTEKKDLITALLNEVGLVRNRFYFYRCVVAIIAKVISRFAVSVSDYILCIAWA